MEFDTILYLTPANLLKCKGSCKNLNYIDLGPSFRVFLGWNVRKLLSYMELAPTNLPKFKVLFPNKNPSKLGPKLPYFEILDLHFMKLLSYF